MAEPDLRPTTLKSTRSPREALAPRAGVTAFFAETLLVTSVLSAAVALAAGCGRPVAELDRGVLDTGTELEGDGVNASSRYASGPGTASPVWKLAGNGQVYLVAGY